MRIVASKDGTVMEILEEGLGSVSRTRIRKMIQYKMLKLEGIPVLKADQRIIKGQAVEYVKAEGRNKHIKQPAPILYEDTHLLVVEKPAGLLTYGERATGGTSLYRALMLYIQKVSNDRRGLFVVHRLDREVSGIVLFAKNTMTQERLKTNWKKTEKYYYALVEGEPANETGTIKSILKEAPDRKVYSVTPPEAGKKAVTHYRVLRRMGKHTLLEVRLETGRKNQIRAHLSEMGCPVVGDRRYGASETFTRRVRLHAFRIRFPHPISGKLLNFESPLPEGFLTLKQKDENYK